MKNPALAHAKVIDLHAHIVIEQTIGAAGVHGPFLGQNPDGSVNMGSTLLLGAGVAALAGGAVLASNGDRHNYGYNQGYAPRYGYGYGRRGW